MDDDFKPAYRQALNILARKRRSSHELTEKLKAKEFSEAHIQKVIKRCEEQGFLNDAEYIQDFVSSQSKKGVGPHLIKIKLVRKFNLSQDAVPALLKTSKIDVKASLALLLKKAKSKRLLETPQGKQKLIQSLMRKGFSYDTIASAIGYTDPSDE